MSPRPPTRQPDGSRRTGDPRRVGHDQQRDAVDGIERGQAPSDLGMRQPNERDTSADGKRVEAVDPVVKQAGRDLAEGRVDTDQRGTAVRSFERAVGRKSRTPPSKESDR